MQIRKAVFPVAGLGTRFLPATKAIPKEMLPVVDVPLIQYATEEAVQAGITELIFIVSRTKNAIQDHYDIAYELQAELERKGKQDLLEIVNATNPEHVSCSFIRQAEAKGLGHAVLCARSVVGNEPFAVLLPDDLIADGNRGCLKQMQDLFVQYQQSIIAVETVANEDTDKYGIVSIEPGNTGVSKITAILEKPKPEHAPSNLAVVGRYILTPEIFACLEKTEKGAGGEIQLTDAIAMLTTVQDVFAYQFEGKRYDCGSKLGFLQATIDYALKDPEIGAQVEVHISNILAQKG